MVKVSIIILTKNAGERFRLLLERIYSQTFKDFEVLVIDSGSKDLTLNIAEEYKVKICRIKPEEFHHSKTRNLGASLAKGEILVYITQDALPLNNHWLENLIMPLENNEDIIAVYGRQIAYFNAKPTEKFFYNYFYPTRKKVLTYNDAKNPEKFYLENVFISNVNSAIKRGVWKKIKFRENLFMAEDKDFSLRALRKSWKIMYEPEACVYHSHNYSVFSIFKRRFKDGFAYKQVTGAYSKSINFNFLFRNGIKYAKELYNFLLINNYKIWMPYVLLYEIMSFMGFILGKFS